MKLTDQHIRLDDKIEIATTQAEKQLQYLTSLKPKPGQKIFEYNLKTKELKEAEINKVYFKYSYPNPIIKKLISNPDCIYTVALNENNAAKHFLKLVKKLPKKNV